jgi:hypothetical protein
MRVIFNSLFILMTLSLSLLSHAETLFAANTICLGDLNDTTVTKDYEANARKLAMSQKLTAEDVLTRLIFAESLSTGCLRHEDCNTVADFKITILTKIGWGIAKRFKSRANEKDQAKLRNDIYDTVFKKFQFRTSFTPKMSGDRENIFAQAFLCPEKIKNYLSEVNINYLDLLKAAQEVAAQVIKNPIIGDYRFVTNFYYPKSPVFGELTPDWAKNAKPIISNDWIKMYNLKSSAYPLMASPIQRQEESVNK